MHDHWRAALHLTDEQVLRLCAEETYRASGPGGQHRNKVSSAVRLRHIPSGLVVTAAECRSQHENRAVAVRRMRESIAVHVRLPLSAEWRWPENVAVEQGRLRVSERNPSLPQAIALVLDALVDAACDPKAAAQKLGLTTTSFTRFLNAHEKAWIEANRLRAAAGLPPLRA